MTKTCRVCLTKTEEDRPIAWRVYSDGSYTCPKHNNYTEEDLCGLRNLTEEEWKIFESVVVAFREMAAKNAHRRPKMTTLVEEFAEAILAARGKHGDPLLLEVEQIGSTAMNLAWQIILYGDSEVANLRTYRKDQT